jgi:hypothetical protein
MKKYIIILFLFVSIAPSYGQSDQICRDLANQSLFFRTHKDSIPNLYEINGGVAVVGNDSINLKQAIGLSFEKSRFYEGKLKTYLLYTGKPNGFYTVLEFCYDRLFCIGFYSDRSYYLSNFKLEIERHFGRKGERSHRITTDSTVTFSDRRVTYGERYSDYYIYGIDKSVKYSYSEDLIKGTGDFLLIDKKVDELIPSWCGTCNNRNTWEKLKTYLDKESRSNNH